MAGNFRIDVNTHGAGVRIQAAAKSARGLTPYEAKRVADAAASGMRSKAPLGRTGNLKRSIKSIVDVAPGGRSTLGTFLPGREFIATAFSTSPYYGDVDQGTGVYGPKHKVITPQSGNVFIMFKEPNALRIERYVTVNGAQVPIYNHSKRRTDRKNDNGQSVVFTRHIRGQPPQHMTNAGYSAALSAAYAAEIRWANRLADEE